MSIAQPLAERLRPKDLCDVFGHPSVTTEGGLIKASLASKHPLSILFWGPPGCGKTTLARIYMSGFDASPFSFHPATHGLSDIKKLMQDRVDHPLLSRRPVIVFVDEIHRLTKAQQDVFLPFLEKGDLTLVAATTENPSFCLTGALLSRIRVIALSHHDEKSLSAILDRALASLPNLYLSNEVKQYLVAKAEGDARALINSVESLLTLSGDKEICLDQVEHFLQKKMPYYDKDKHAHFNAISAFHKAIRGSDPDAALYWLCRMLSAGEDPKYLARRIIRIATEDIGLADPEALSHAIHAAQSYERLGSPEGELALAQACVYLALSPKSNAIYTAYKSAKMLAEKTSHLPPPKRICNAPTKLMKDMGYGKGYTYDHDTPFAFSGQNYFPEGLESTTFYKPEERGFEREMKKRIEFFSRLRSHISKD